MEFKFFFEVKRHFFSLFAYANEKTHRWECGGAFGSDWTEKKWYEGILLFCVEGRDFIFFFKTYEARDEKLPEFTLESLFGAELSHRQIFALCKEKAQELSQSPFLFVEIGRDFALSLNKIPNAEVCR